MRATIWILSTTLPGDPMPCWPRAFGTLAEAQAAFLEAMENEWPINGPSDEDTGDVPPFPTTDDGKPDAEEAHDLMVENDASSEWGRWEITSHDIDVPDAAPAGPDPCNIGDAPPCPDGLTLYRAEVLQDCSARTLAWVAAKHPQDAIGRWLDARRGGDPFALTKWTEPTHGDPFDTAELRIYAADDEDFANELANEEG